MENLGKKIDDLMGQAFYGTITWGEFFDEIGRLDPADFGKGATESMVATLFIDLFAPSGISKFSLASASAAVEKMTAEERGELDLFQLRRKLRNGEMHLSTANEEIGRLNEIVQNHGHGDEYTGCGVCGIPSRPD